FFFQAEDGIRDRNVTGVQTCALPICALSSSIGSITTSEVACNSSTAPVGVPAVMNAASIFPSLIPPADSPKSKFCASISSIVISCTSTICSALIYVPEPGAPTETFLPSKSSTDSIPESSTVTISIVSGYNEPNPNTVSIGSSKSLIPSAASAATSVCVNAISASPSTNAMILSAEALDDTASGCMSVS